MDINEAIEAYYKAEEAMKATPEYKDWAQAYTASYKADKARNKAWKAVEATPAYKAYKKAENDKYRAVRVYKAMLRWGRKNNDVQKLFKYIKNFK